MIGLPPIRSGSEYYGTDYMGSNIIVWDLETVPDLAGFAAANDLVGKSDAEVREAIGDKFPKHIYHSIVCIGALIAHRETDHWAVDAVGAPHVGERTEKQLITAFKIAERGHKQLARLLRKPQSFVSNYERGQRRVEVLELLRISLKPWRATRERCSWTLPGEHEKRGAEGHDLFAKLSYFSAASGKKIGFLATGLANVARSPAYLSYPPT
jgi:hypothetical protein